MDYIELSLRVLILLGIISATALGLLYLLVLETHGNPIELYLMKIHVAQSVSMLATLNGHTVEHQGLEVGCPSCKTLFYCGYSYIATGVTISCGVNTNAYPWIDEKLEQELHWQAYNSVKQMSIIQKIKLLCSNIPH